MNPIWAANITRLWLLVVMTLLAVPFSARAESPTPSATPLLCAPDVLTASLADFETFGLVRVEVFNTGSAAATLNNFEVSWVQRAPGVLALARLSAFSPLGMPGSVTVWESGAEGEDAAPPTPGRGEGLWMQNYTVLPNSQVSLYLDFDGTAGDLRSFGVQFNDFAGTWLEFSCGGPAERVILTGTEVTATPTATLSRTPIPTGTFTPTPTQIPTGTFTPPPTLPPTFTFTPGVTLTPTESPFPTIPSFATQTYTPPATWTPETSTSTPDCSPAALTVQIQQFEPFGLVLLWVYNEGGAVVWLADFEIHWWQPDTNPLTLARVSAFAAPGNPGSQAVWDSSSPNEDALPPTFGQGEGAWQGNLPVAPGYTTLYLDFDGTSASLPALGITETDFAGSWLAFDLSGGCPLQIMELDIPIFDTPTPIPSVTPHMPSPSPSWTPFPTITSTPRPPTATFSPTPTPTLTFTPTSPPDAVPLRNRFTTRTPTLTWRPVTYATAYEVQVDTETSFAVPLIYQIIVGDTLTLTIPPEYALANGLYYWHVRARDVAGRWGGWSRVDSFVVDAP